MSLLAFVLLTAMIFAFYGPIAAFGVLGAFWLGVEAGSKEPRRKS